ncbi:putative membrane channel-forming protein YqfA (hemolysin III family) [Leucobacter exalbidus]|uniref:Membrane channel-forming protein YqfA (Hemolysin III family) n=1 Tax=Leucobacter exalbidus TaxID=662960 RepID=A0A940T4S1_9MICO|nr:hypothetical protein [Leucobacter exalbidus]MBP1327527.1 putative membrane channel-forming protein YqfA (hemolysin III family) [Leucobacter exalbidus]
MAEKPTKRVSEVKAKNPEAAPGWKPTPESAAKATQLRIVSWCVWAVAIGAEAFAIFWVLKQVPVKMWLLIVLIVVAGILSVVGSLCWKQANRLDPASNQDKLRFFVQNQLGAIIAVIAFLPLIIMIFLNKNMDGKQKAVAGGIGVVVLLIAGALGVSWDSPSQEQYAAETNIVKQLTGEDLVFWTKSGGVFHVCESVPDVNKESKDGTIYQGTVAAAHEAGKDRLTKRWESEALNYCGYTEADVANATSGIDVANLDATDPESTDTDSADTAPADTESANDAEETPAQ